MNSHALVHEMAFMSILSQNLKAIIILNTNTRISHFKYRYTDTCAVKRKKVLRRVINCSVFHKFI